MTLHRSLFILAFLALLLTACAASTPTPTADVESAASSTPSLASTLPHISPTPLPSASPTPAPAANQCAPAPEPAKTAVPTFPVVKQCAVIENGIPADVKIPGGLVAYDYRRDISVVEDFNQQGDAFKRAPYPNLHDGYQGDYFVSSDKKWMAWIETSKGPNRQDAIRKLKVANLNGLFLNLSFWQIDWQYIVGWQDNHHLLIYTPKYPKGTLVLLDPFAATWVVIPPNLPYLDPGKDWKTFDNMVLYNPTRSQVVYLEKYVVDNYDYGRWVFYDQNFKKALWKSNPHSELPVWSPDGTKFAFFDRRRDCDQCDWITNLKVVDAAGKETWLTGPISYNTYYSHVTWSADSQKLSAWINFDTKNDGYWDPLQLAIFDLQAQTVKDLCITTDNIGYENIPPIWSPDDRFIAIRVSSLEKDASWWRDQFDVILVDTQQNRAYRLYNHQVPYAWMVR